MWIKPRGRGAGRRVDYTFITHPASCSPGQAGYEDVRQFFLNVNSGVGLIYFMGYVDSGNLNHTSARKWQHRRSPSSRRTASRYLFRDDNALSPQSSGIYVSIKLLQSCFANLLYYIFLHPLAIYYCYSLSTEPCFCYFDIAILGPNIGIIYPSQYAITWYPWKKSYQALHVGRSHNNK